MTRHRSPYLPLALAVSCASLGAILVRYAGAPPLAVAFHRVFLASVLLSPFAARTAYSSWARLERRQRLSLLASGTALAIHFATWIASLSHTSVAVSVLLVNTAPVFALLLSRFILRESVPKVVGYGIAVALAGAAIIAASDWHAGSASLLGASLALAGAVSLAVYHVIGRGLRDALPLNAYVLSVWSVAALVLGPVALVFGVSLVSHSASTFGVLLALALVPTIGGHGLLNVALRRLPAPTVGLFMLGEPVGATLLAYPLFGETPHLMTLLGGLLVLAALAAVVAHGNPKPRPAPQG